MLKVRIVWLFQQLAMVLPLLGLPGGARQTFRVREDHHGPYACPQWGPGCEKPLGALVMFEP